MENRRPSGRKETPEQRVKRIADLIARQDEIKSKMIEREAEVRRAIDSAMNEADEALRRVRANPVYGLDPDTANTD